MTPKEMLKRSSAIVVVLALAFLLVAAMTSIALGTPYAPYTAGPVVSEELPYAPYTAGPVVNEAAAYAPYTAGPIVREIRTLPFAGYTDLAPRPAANPRIGNFPEF